MMLFRLILFAIIGYLIFRIYRPINPPRGGSAGPQKLRSEAMVQCALCRVHVPRTTAVAQDELWYCSPEHKDKHQQQLHPDNDAG